MWYTLKKGSWVLTVPCNIINYFLECEIIDFQPEEAWTYFEHESQAKHRTKARLCYLDQAGSIFNQQ